MGKLLFILFGIIAYVLLCMACTCRHEKDLRGLTVSAVPASASPSPRTGASPTAAPDAATGRLEVVREGGTVRLRGMVPSQDVKDALIAEATKQYGADGFTESIQIASPAAEVDPDWKTLALKGVVWGGLGDVAIDGRTIALRGKQPTADAKRRRYEYVQSIVPDGWKASDEMRVADAPAPPPRATPGGSNATTPQNLKAFQNISFETGSAVITPGGERLLNEAAAVMEKTVPTRYEIGGHTDDRGADAANQNLSERRADAVRKYLMDAGIAPERLEARGYGESRPLTPNNSDAGRARNRRIEFTELK